LRAAREVGGWPTYPFSSITLIVSSIKVISGKSFSRNGTLKLVVRIRLIALESSRFLDCVTNIVRRADLKSHPLPSARPHQLSGCEADECEHARIDRGIIARQERGDAGGNKNLRVRSEEAFQNRWDQRMAMGRETS
jgi:hypothetical protein